MARKRDGITRRDGVYIPKPEGFELPTVSIHVNGDSGEKKKRPRRRFHRLRVTMEEGHGVRNVRNVYWEFSYYPIMHPKSVWVSYLWNLSVQLEVVAEIIRTYRDMPGAVLVYEPGGNMAGFLNPKPNGQTSLFE